MRAQPRAVTGSNGSGDSSLFARLRTRLYPFGSSRYPKPETRNGLTEHECLSLLGYERRFNGPAEHTDSG